MSNFSKKTKMIVGSILCLTVFALLSYAGFAYYRYSRPALEIGDVRISKKMYKKLVTQAKQEKMSEKDAQKVIIEITKQKVAAQEIGIEVSDSDAKNAVAQIYGAIDVEKDTTSFTEWRMLRGNETAIKNSIYIATKGGYQGAIFDFPFHRYLDRTNIGTPDPKYGDEKAISDDKAYALEKANSYHDKLLSKSISIKQSVDEILADTRLRGNTTTNSTQEFAIDPDGRKPLQGGNSTTLIARDFLNDLKIMKEGEVSDVRAKTSYVSLYKDPKTSKPVETDYTFVVLAKKLNATTDIQQKFDKAKLNVKVKKRV